MAFDVFLTAQAWISLFTLTALEIILGIDNIVFISILSGKLPPHQRLKARRVGLGLALITRLLLLFTLSWMMSATKPWFSILEHPISMRDIVLMAGGLFLIAKATLEIFENLEVEAVEQKDGSIRRKAAPALLSILIQIMFLDIVFSLDSVITAVGMANHLIVMVLAMCLAVCVMLIFAGPVGDFVNNHPSIKILALSFLLLVGVMLTGEALGQHINKGYIYFAMAFSLLVEMINMRVRRVQLVPVHLHQQMPPEPEN